MKSALGSLLYKLVLPLFFVLSLPAWIRKNRQRGGFGTGLRERFGFYRGDLDFESCHSIHIHAISVGESLLALKLIRAWREISPEQRFVLAVGTPTAHHVARNTAPAGVRVAYAPLDFPCTVRAYLRRFEPRAILFIEGELWPNLLKICQKNAIPMHLLNARFSPRSRARYLRFATWIAPVFSRISSVCLQHEADRPVWQHLGLKNDQIILTGSLKLDPSAGNLPQKRDEFSELLTRAFPPTRHQQPLVLIASSHPGEEAYLAEILRDLPVRVAITPRHAERRHELVTELRALNLAPVLRSQNLPPISHENACLLIDTTGELSDWTAHADVVLIGKSFLSQGGQNPCEAILAHKPIITGPNMQNFEPLSTTLREKSAIRTAHTPEDLRAHLHALLFAPNAAQTTQLQCRAARAILTEHEHATQRIIQHVRNSITK